VVDQGGQVFLSFPERRQGHGDDFQPVKQVFPERSGLDFGFQVAVGCADDPHVYGNADVAAQARDFPLLEKAQQFDLDGGAQFADFIEEQRAAVRFLEPADAPRAGAGVSAFFMSEQFALQQVFLQRAAVDDDDGLVRARAQLVDQAREQFLARAAFPLDQDGRPAGRHAAGHVDELHHLVAFVDDLFGGHAALAQLLPEQFVFPDQAPAFRNAVHQQKQLIELHGLGDVVDGADLDRFDGRFNGAVGGDDDDVDLMVDALHFLEHVHAVHAGHLVVQQDEVEGVVQDRLDGRLAVFRLLDPVAFRNQKIAQHFPLRAAVLNNQNV